VANARPLATLRRPWTGARRSIRIPEDMYSMTLMSNGTQVVRAGGNLTSAQGIF